MNKTKVPEGYEGISFKECLKRLGIEKYGERIFSSNSHGELFHLADYHMLATTIDNKDNWFGKYFDGLVKWAEKEWERPESIFQHIPRMLTESIKSQDPNP